MPRSSLYYQPITNEYKEKIKSRLIEIHQDIPCYGYIKAQKQLNEALFLNPLNWKKVDKISIEI
ncbi:hypothetical protein [Francisella sp. TX07-6608]|uniref:hypothetical protein n=1 Tax=Francisella sp. TX07-6608 TaxID=573568 RepID=UPI0011609131|nr:hypothetical protein [Francisella sp. TX07-6608]